MSLVIPRLMEPRSDNRMGSEPPGPSFKVCSNAADIGPKHTIALARSRSQGVVLSFGAVSVQWWPIPNHRAVVPKRQQGPRLGGQGFGWLNLGDRSAIAQGSHILGCSSSLVFSHCLCEWPALDSSFLW